MWAALILMAKRDRNLYFLLDLSCFFRLFNLGRCWHTVAQTHIVIRSANYLEWFCLFESCNKTWFIWIAFLHGWGATQLIELVWTPWVELVIFRKDHNVFKTTTNSLDSFRKRAFATWDCHRLKSVRDILPDSKLAFIVQTPCVDIAASW